MGEGLFDRIRAGLFGFFGGPADPRLSPQQNTAAAREALANAGLQTILASRGRGTLEALALGALAGRETGAASRSTLVERERLAQMAELFKSGEVDVKLLQRAFGQAVAAGDHEMARTLSVVLQGALGATGRDYNLTTVERFNPHTGQVEIWNRDPRTGALVGTEPIGIAPPRVPLVNLGGSQESSMNAAFGQAVGQQLAAAVQAGQTAQADLARLEELGQLLSMPGVYQGTAGPLVLRVKEIGTALGIPGIEGVAESQAARAIGHQLALRYRNPESGFGLPGAISNRELDFLQRIVPGLENTPEGNRLILETTRRVAQRQVEVARAIEEYVAQNGSIDLGVYKFVRDRFANADMFADLRAQVSPFIDLIPPENR